jgi:hypothetical protein
MELVIGEEHRTRPWSKLWNWLFEKNIELVIGVNHGTISRRKNIELTLGEKQRTISRK